MKANVCKNSTFQVNRKKNGTGRQRLTSSNKAAIFCQHFMRRTTQQTLLAINLASQQKTKKLFFSSQLRKQFKLLTVPFKPLRCCLRSDKLVNCLACENIRYSSLFVAEDVNYVSRGGTSATQRQKFHTDDVKSVQNPVRSADWSTEQLRCFGYCLQMTDKRQKATKVKCKHEESLTKQSIFVQYSLL